MKMNKKKLLSLSLVIVLIAIMSFGTLAWFNAQDEITNTFYVADSDGDGTPNFSIDVKEWLVDENGNPVADENGDPVYTEESDQEGNKYYNILPGDKLPKSAFVENTGDYDQWVRVHLTFSDWPVWEAAIEKASEAANMEFDEYVFDKLLSDLFDESCEDTYYKTDVFGNDTMTYTFYYKYVVTSTQEPIQVISGINIPVVLVQEDMNFGTDGFTLAIKAEAVQADNMPSPASAAFAEAGWEIGANYGA